MSAGFDPYHKLLGIPPEEQPPDHYRLLGLSRRFEDDIEVIENCSNRVMQSLRQHQSGVHGSEIAKLLNEVSVARRTLLNPEKKLAYDDELRNAEIEVVESEPDVSFETDVDPLLKFKQRRHLLIPAVLLVVAVAIGVGCYVTFSKPPVPDEIAAVNLPQNDLGPNELGSNKLGPNQERPNQEGPNQKGPDAGTAGKVELPGPVDPRNTRPAIPNVVPKKTVGAGQPEFRIRLPAIKLPILARGATSQNLLSEINPELDGSSGRWTKDASGLVSNSDETAILVLPFESIPTAMIFELAIERLEDSPGELFVQIPTSAKPAVYGIDVGSPPRNGVYIDSEKLEDAPRVQAVSFIQPRVVNTFELACRGTSLGIQARPESPRGGHHYSWSGDFRRLNGPTGFPSIPNRVVILTRGARFRISSLTYRATDESVLSDPPAEINQSDLIAAIDLTRDVQRGDWGDSQNPIVAPATPYARLQLPIVLPAEYDMSVSLEIPDEQGGFVVGLPVEGAVLRCFINPRQSDIPGLGIQPFSSNVFPVGERVQFDFQVRKNSIRMMKAGRVLRSQNLRNLDRVKPDDFTLPWLTDDEQRRIFFGSNGSTYKIHGVGVAANSEPQLASTLVPERGATGFQRPVGSLAGPDDEMPANATSKLKEPELAAHESAINLVKAQFKSEFQKAKKPIEKLALAERLKTTADGEPTESATRFVLLEQVADLCVAAGDPKLALDAIDELSGTFECDVLRRKTDLLKVAVKWTKEPEKVRILLESAFSLAQQAADAEKYLLANDLYGIVSAISVKAKLRAVTDEATDFKREMTERQDLLVKVEAARKVLNANQVDPEAQLVIGQYSCLIRDDWDSGLAALRQCSVPELKRLAERDFTPPQTSADQVALAKDWLAYAASGSQHEHAGYAERAVHWLTLAAAESQGLQQTQLQLLLKEAVRIRDWDQPYVQLLEKLSKSIELKRFVRTPTIGMSLNRVVPFDELPSEPGLLVGLELRVNPSTVTSNGQRRNIEQIDIVRGIFQTSQGTKFAEGSLADEDPNGDTTQVDIEEIGGRAGPSRLIQLRARRGYALAGIRMETVGGIYRLVALFRKITAKGLDPERSYWSETIGSGYPVGRASKFQESPDTRNVPIVGITGDRPRTGRNLRINQIGFILCAG